MAIKKVIISGGAKKELKKLPIHIVRKLLTWVDVSNSKVSKRFEIAEDTMMNRCPGNVGDNTQSD